jgi:hypothetical protein
MKIIIPVLIVIFILIFVLPSKNNGLVMHPILSEIEYADEILQLLTNSNRSPRSILELLDDNKMKHFASGNNNYLGEVYLYHSNGNLRFGFSGINRIKENGYGDDYSYDNDSYMEQIRNLDIWIEFYMEPN